MKPGTVPGAFELLHPILQRWIWQSGWQELRQIQKASIPLIIEETRDLIISADTASGKTEAAFLPICTKLLSSEPADGLVVYISPLTALINDQFLRLSGLCRKVRIPICPWHAGVSHSQKRNFFKNPSGVLLITPESLEALLCNHGFRIFKLFRGLRYFVVDELHSFMGSERGRQLQTLLHIIEQQLGRRVVRVGLSATLGNLKLAADFLSPTGCCDIVKSMDSPKELLVLVKGVEKGSQLHATAGEDMEEKAHVQIAADLFKTIRGTSNLVFPASRALVELYTHLLSKLCKMEHIPNEFYPHHGSLSQEIREYAEAAIKNNASAATIICTNTLELGVDIGAVHSVVQIGPAPSVASLRQRLGRSGRGEGEQARLRAYTIEEELSTSLPLLSKLRASTFEMVASIMLLRAGWCEPPISSGLHLSTLVQQVLALISQNSGIQPIAAYRLLCEAGPFRALSAKGFLQVLQTLIEKNLIVEDASGLLLHGTVGEQLAGHYSFYAAFVNEEMYQVFADSQILGSLPTSSVVQAGDFILFAGQTWEIASVDHAAKALHLQLHKLGEPPIFFKVAGSVHTAVRKKMLELYKSDEDISFIDSTAKRFISEGREAFRHYNLSSSLQSQCPPAAVVFTWLGDAANLALCALLRFQGLHSKFRGPTLEFIDKGFRLAWLSAALRRIASAKVPDARELLRGLGSLRREKWDWALSAEMLAQSYASTNLDVASAMQWIRQALAELP